MLKYKVGDLIEAAVAGEVNVIAHGCNTYCTMGSGIAPQIKKRFPAAYAMDLGTVKGDWDIIEMMIKKTLIFAGHDVTIYTLE